MVVLLLLAGGAAPAFADLLVSNLDEELRYALAVNAEGTPAHSGVTVSVHSVDSAGNPGALIHLLSNPPSIASGSLANFTAAAGATLDTATTYFVVVAFSGTGLDHFSVRATE